MRRNERNNRKRRQITVLALLILLILGIYFIASTYARYANEITGNAKTNVALWKIAFKDGENNTLTNAFNLNFKVEANNNVVSGKIAPATKLTATIIADLTGTEVAVDYESSINEDALTTIFGDSADSVVVTTTAKVAGTEDTSGTIALVDDKAFTASNGKVEITVSLEWTNDDTKNDADTAIGKAGGEIVIPVTLSLKQHIGA